MTCALAPLAREVLLHGLASCTKVVLRRRLVSCTPVLLLEVTSTVVVLHDAAFQRNVVLA
jgi:hypothetical protein